MTNEEASFILANIDRRVCDDELNDALDVAIKALEQEPCDDCISREATIDAIYKKYIGGKDAIKNAPINDLYADGLEEAVDAVWDMPSVQPTRPTGKWKKYLDEGGFLQCECSNCGLITNEPDNYCPNCGARMGESEKEIW